MDTLVITQNGTVTITVDVPCLNGIPFAVEFRPAMKHLEKAWYEATRRYGPYNFHPQRCEDWNLESGGNTDLGEPLVAPFSGLVLAAVDYGGSTGKIVQLLGATEQGELIVWSGWHLQDTAVEPGRVVTAGQDIGAIGNAGGYYAGAHLHEQICVVGRFGIPAPNTFASDDRYAWRQPSRFYVERGFPAVEMERLTRYGE